LAGSLAAAALAWRQQRWCNGWLKGQAAARLRVAVAAANVVQFRVFTCGDAGSAWMHTPHYDKRPSTGSYILSVTSDMSRADKSAAYLLRMHRPYFQIKPELPRSQWRSTKMTVKINSTADLWRTCYKSPYATIEIPELEFEFSADGKRHTDSIYNHIGSAVYNLGAWVVSAGDE
jgi:hypothetical protein